MDTANLERLLKWLMISFTVWAVLLCALLFLAANEYSILSVSATALFVVLPGAVAGWVFIITLWRLARVLERSPIVWVGLTIISTPIGPLVSYFLMRHLVLSTIKGSSPTIQNDSTLTTSGIDNLYELVALELAKGEKQLGLWTRAEVESGGDEKATRLLYIKWRVQQLSDDHIQSANNATLTHQGALHPPERMGLRKNDAAATSASLDDLLKFYEKEIADAERQHGYNPLHWAVSEGHHQLINELIKYRKRYINDENKYGQTPLDIAALTKRDAVVAALKGAG